MNYVNCDDDARLWCVAIIFHFLDYRMGFSLVIWEGASLNFMIMLKVNLACIYHKHLLIVILYFRLVQLTCKGSYLSL